MILQTGGSLFGMTLRLGRRSCWFESSPPEGTIRWQIIVIS
jgi:hypothetical protein